MSSNVGLSTPRGSGTSGYVQRNLSVLKPRTFGAGAPYTPSSTGGIDSRGPPRQRKPDQEILHHDRLRDIEIKVLDLRDTLEDAGQLTDAEIDARCNTLRAELVSESERNGGGSKKGAKAKPGRDGLKRYQVHELAEAKIKESDRLRRALGLKGDEIGVADGGVGDDREHPMARQERKKRERELERAKVDSHLEREE